MNKSRGHHVCSLTDAQQQKDNPKDLEVDGLYLVESIKIQVIVESYDKYRDFVGNSVEGEYHKPCKEFIFCSGKESFINYLEICNRMIKENLLIDGKLESKKPEEVGSLMGPIYSEEDISRLPRNIMKNKNPLNATSQGNWFAGTVEFGHLRTK